MIAIDAVEIGRQRRRELDAGYAGGRAGPGYGWRSFGGAARYLWRVAGAERLGKIRAPLPSEGSTVNQTQEATP